MSFRQPFFMSNCFGNVRNMSLVATLVSIRKENSSCCFEVLLSDISAIHSLSHRRTQERAGALNRTAVNIHEKKSLAVKTNLEITGRRRYDLESVWKHEKDKNRTVKEIVKKSSGEVLPVRTWC